MNSSERNSAIEIKRPVSQGTIEPLREKTASLCFTPTRRTYKLTCPYISHSVCPEAPFERDIWLAASTAEINRLSATGIRFEPEAWARFLWNDDYLYFYIEVEQNNPGEANNDTFVWLGNSIEFLISPHWFVKPFRDEYEILFNSNNAMANLHWQENTLDEALQWEAEGLTWKLAHRLHFIDHKKGWSFWGAIPFDSLKRPTPTDGEYWGLGLFRKYINNGQEALIAWSPTLNNPTSFHTPARFGMLVFTKE